MKKLFAILPFLALSPSAFADSRLCNEFYPAKTAAEKNLICTTLVLPIKFVESSMPADRFINEPLSELVQLNVPLMSLTLGNMAKAGYVPHDYFFTAEFVNLVGSKPMTEAIDTIMATYNTHYKRPQ